MAQVHRFHDSVALYIGTGETVYLTHDQAQQLGRALIDCAHDVWKVPFGKSDIGTVRVDIGDSAENKYAQIERG